MVVSIEKPQDAVESEVQPLFITGPRRHRRINPEAGRALEILGHAIEYLADEYVYKGKSFSASDPQVRAIQLLMALSRQIYFECPVVPTLAEQLRKLIRVRGSLGL
jgi:hypothetical protein